MPKKGYKPTEEHRKKLSLAKLGKAIGEKHHNWKADSVSYRALHFWVERRLGKSRECDSCHITEPREHRMHWANVSGKYLRDITDWIRLCSKCHGAYDANKRKQTCI